LSSAEILAVLFTAVLRTNPRHPEDPERDRFILSKGHAAASLYAMMAIAGYFDVKELDTFMQPMSRLCGHPSIRYLPGIEASTGPLGHGLPVAVGIALAGRLDANDRRTFVLAGDGELDEGSNWEAAMAAAHFGLDRLTLIVDRNGVQLGGTTESTMRLEPLSRKFRAFGWATKTVPGHDPAALLDAFEHLPLSSGKPSCLIARTHKGHGVSFLEDRVESHNYIPNAEELKQAMLELGEIDDVP
jgi:transketolase